MKKLSIFATLTATFASQLAISPSVFSVADSVSAAPSSPLVIQAVNPGYTVDGQANMGELIELKNLSPDSLSLTGYSLYYTNSSGNRSNLIEFPEGSRISGEASIVLRLVNSKEASSGDLLYSKTLAMAAGPLELVHGESIISSVCWDGSSTCLAKFSKDTPTTIVRDNSTATYTHQTNYAPDWSSTPSGYFAPALADTEENLPSRCRGLQFSELLSYYDETKAEQFIEFYNSTDETINLTECAISYKKKLYYLFGTVGPGEYYIRSAEDFILTKNPTSSNTLILLDANGDQLDILEYPHGQKKSASFALIGYDVSGQGIWQITYRPTPGDANIFQEYRTCPAGKVINKITGNCVKVATLKTITDCPAGKYRNPATGRCKKIETGSSPTPCKDGYERNPETNRCRKVKNNTGASYALVPETGGESSSFIAVGALIVVISIGIAYLVYQFRRELLCFFRRLFQKITHHSKK